MTKVAVWMAVTAACYAIHIHTDDYVSGFAGVVAFMWATITVQAAADALA